MTVLMVIGDQIMGLRQDITELRKELAEYNGREAKDITMRWE